jgi:hypothetical protein
MRTWMLLLSFASVLAFGAEIKDVAYSCSAKECSLRFQFASAKNLPNFYQKYDAVAHKLTVGFSDTKTSFDGMTFDLSDAKGLSNVRVFTDASMKLPLLKFEFSVGDAVHSDKNPVSLSARKNFVISLPKSSAAAWSLGKLASAKNARAEKAKSDSAASAKAQAAEQKKLALDSLKAVRKAKSDSAASAKALAAEQKKRSADSLAAVKKAKADSAATAKVLAAEQKKRTADSLKALKMTAAEKKKRVADSLAAVKKAKADSIQEVKDQANKKVVSALIEGIRSMTGIQGGGIEQFRIVTDSEMELSKVQGPDKSSIIYVAVPGPKKTPLFNVSTGDIVKSVTWMSTGLRIQLHSNVHPAIFVYKGSLILQISRATPAKGFVCYMAKPEGVYVRKWTAPAKASESFEEFSKEMDSEKKKIVSVAQSFGLRRVARNLIVVAESTPFLASPSEKAAELETLDFGTHLEDIELNGLFYKVRLGSKVGYVNRRAVSFPDELSAVQAERLKQLALEQGGPLDTNAVHFEHPIEERVSYSSFGRRDPFIEVKGLMEEGINIDQVELVGIIWESEVPLAILADSKNPEISYTVKEGDRILNGKVLKITQTDVLFLLQEFGVSRRYSMSLPDLYGSNAK